MDNATSGRVGFDRRKPSRDLFYPILCREPSPNGFDLLAGTDNDFEIESVYFEVHGNVIRGSDSSGDEILTPYAVAAGVMTRARGTMVRTLHIIRLKERWKRDKTHRVWWMGGYLPP
jgi:hypothetical protein